MPIPQYASRVLPVFLRDIAVQHFELTVAPSAIPADVQAGLAAEFQHTRLAMAAPEEPFNDTCMADDRLPSRRLILAAVNPRYAVVHFEEGGFAPLRRVVLLKRTVESARAIVLWSSTPLVDFRDTESFLAALRTGSLWQD